MTEIEWIKFTLLTERIGFRAALWDLRGDRPVKGSAQGEGMTETEWAELIALTERVGGGACLKAWS